MYRASDYPKDKVSFSLNTIEEETVTSAATVTTVTPSTSHEAIEDHQLVEETEVEEEEEYDTDSDAEYPIADKDEEDSLDDLVFLRAVTRRSGRMGMLHFYKPEEFKECVSGKNDMSEDARNLDVDVYGALDPGGCLLPIYKCATRGNTKHLSRQIYSLADPPALPRVVLRKLLEKATKKSHLLFDGKYYDQIDGVAMGSPLGPVLANIFMCVFEEKWLLNAKVSPLIWNRYVDDTFTMFHNKDCANEFLHYLNGCHRNIKFTIVFEHNEAIPFLDILVTRNQNNAFTTSIYRKKTFTGLYTKWDSFTPRKYKINLIRSLTYRYYRLCSSGSLLQSALNDFRKLLLQNGYPQGIINYHINDVLNKNRQHQHSNPVSTVPKKDIVIQLPYLGLQSNQVGKRLKSCVHKNWLRWQG
ncbi:uncharacterized protein [Montipora foliosa]|uniref:uncharacterized protein n=1 Tax=Montipora foliosa TaxID=591990 RepID=UPI0035F0FAD0